MARADVAAVAAVVISALSMLGCSDSPEPPAQGGLSVEFRSTSVPGEVCPTITATTFGVGNPPPAVDGSSMGVPIISGEDETEVHCTVSKNGSFRGTIAASNVSLDLRGTIAGPGSILVSTPAHSLTVSGDNICTFDAQEPYAYRPGSLYIGFYCPGARNPDYSGTVCNLSGSVVVRQCAE